LALHLGADAAPLPFNTDATRVEVGREERGLACASSKAQKINSRAGIPKMGRTGLLGRWKERLQPQAAK